MMVMFSQKSFTLLYPGTEGAAESGSVRRLQKRTLPRQPGFHPCPSRPTHYDTWGYRSSASRCPPLSQPRSTMAAHHHLGYCWYRRNSWDPPVPRMANSSPDPRLILKTATVCVRANSGLPTRMDVDFRVYAGKSLKGPGG